MGNKLWNCTGLTGGTTGDLDAISVASLTDGDRAIVSYGGGLYVFEYDASSSDVEISPNYIKPDDYVTTGTWKLLEINKIVLEENVKTADFTAEVNKYRYVIDGWPDVIEVTLPDTGLSDGDEIAFYFASNSDCTFTCAGLDINGSASDFPSSSATFARAAYLPSYGWAVVNY